MISESRSYYEKVEEYFEHLAKCLDYKDIEGVEKYLARLSPYFYMFNNDQVDAYNEATETLDSHDFWDSEPTEMDEWADYDPDC